MKDEENSKEVKNITIEVIRDKCNRSNKNSRGILINLSTQFSDNETIRILKQCLISLEKESSQRSTN